MRKIIIYMLIFILIVVSGCGKQPQLKELAVVAGVAIDKKGDNKYEVTTQTIKPGAVKKDKPKPYINSSTTGFTIFEAVRDLIMTEGKKQLWSHVSAFIVGEETAKDTVIPITDFMIRDHEPRPRMKAFVSRGKAKKILELKSEVFPVPAMGMKQSLEEQTGVSKAPDVEFHDFIERLVEPYQDPYLPVIQKKEDHFEIFGTAVFKKDKVVGFLTPRETRAMLRVSGKLKGGLQVIKLPSEQEDKPNYTSIEIKKSKTSIKAKIEKNKPKIMIKIKEIGFIGGINQSITLDQKKVKEMEKIYADTIKKEVEHMLKKVQKEYKSSLFNFSGVINREDKEYWKQHRDEWEEIYPDLEVIVEVETHIPENGLYRK